MVDFDNFSGRSSAGASVPHHRKLVVEDEGIVALNIQGKLESVGYHVPCIVSSAEEAMGAARACTPTWY